MPGNIYRVRFGRRPLRTLIILGLLLPFWLPQQHAYACSCAPPGSPEAALQEATAVFSGKVTDMQIGSPDRRLGFQRSWPFIYREFAFATGAKITFAVTEVWQGKPYQTIIIHTSPNGASCGLEGVSVGAEWLVYAYGDQQFLSSHLCTRTRLLADASEDLAILGTGDAPTIARVNETSSTGWVIGSCLAVIFLFIAAFLLMKRRRYLGDYSPT